MGLFLPSFTTGPLTSTGGAADKRSGGAAWRPTFQLSVKLVISRWWLVIRCWWWWRQRWNISDWCAYPHAFEPNVWRQSIGSAIELATAQIDTRQLRKVTARRDNPLLNWRLPEPRVHLWSILWLTFQVFTFFRLVRGLENWRKMSTLFGPKRLARQQSRTRSLYYALNI